MNGRILNGYEPGKPKSFVMFADLDGTFTPMDLKGKEDFIACVREITDQCHVQVKFVPVSGRPAGYVLRVLHECRDMLESVGLTDVCDFGAAEQGAVIVDSARSYAQGYMGYDQNKGLKSQIGEILRKNEYRAIVSDEPDKLYTCSIHIKNEAKAGMTEDQQMDVYKSIRDDIWARFGQDTLFIAMSHNCMEVMHKEISKSKAIDLVLGRYRRFFDIVGMCMCGDAENDKIALAHMSRLAEIPGVRAHVFTPSNSQKSVSTTVLEAWKEQNDSTSQNRIRKSQHRLFRGITSLIRDELAMRTLVGSGLPRWNPHCSFDEHDLPKTSRAERTYRRMSHCHWEP